MYDKPVDYCDVAKVLVSKRAKATSSLRLERESVLKRARKVSRMRSKEGSAEGSMPTFNTRSTFGGYTASAKKNNGTSVMQITESQGFDFD